ncbi:hypothetical protein RND71_012439 [Anisodus tanguticus]|uniref:Uncharacterized protein n=1 Tax=Anisodus tanguticus TaxID=243964 RepID=A0AAE1VGY6_9SOLA|nr:hypothetical protein RND71_012439 [Anisodus tanguticus]
MRFYSSEIGKLKLEDRIEKGYFLAPKAYAYIPEGGGDSVLRFKGPAKRHATQEWFESQYVDPSRKQNVNVDSNFSVNWRTFTVQKKTTTYKLGVNPEAKRDLIYVDEGLWVVTSLIYVELDDDTALDSKSRQLVQALMDQIKKWKSDLLDNKEEEREIPTQEFEFNGKRKGNDDEICQIEKEDDDEKNKRLREESTAEEKDSISTAGWKAATKRLIEERATCFVKKKSEPLIPEEKEKPPIQ